MFKRIFLIEDDPSHALLIKRALREEGSEIFHSLTVAEALPRLAAESSLDAVIISDLQLPDSDGISHIGKFVQAAPLIPLMVLTSSTALSDAVAALKQGAKDFLVKDFNADFGNFLRLALARLFSMSELDRERRGLLRDLNILRVAIEGSTDGLAVAESSGVIGYSNQSFQSFATLIGGNVQDLFSLLTDKVEKSEAVQESLSQQAKSLAPGGVWSSEVAVKGTDRAFELSVMANRVEDQRRIVVWLRDRTDQKRREKFQRELLSTTTHDLKGPLGAIRVSAELLQNQLPKEERPWQLVIRIASAVQNCINLIDEFLSARRIQEGSLRLKPAAYDLTKIVGEVVDEFFPIATSRSISLKSESTGIPVMIDCDALGIKRVVGNLVSNALKFTPTGGAVTVSVNKFLEGGSVSVSDTGPGMEPSEVQRLFERFSRLDRHSQVEGSGLGLFVVRSIVNAHGGTIQVVSQVQLGTRFEVLLPEKPPINARGELECLDFA